jgi:uncharacterized protein YeaO (DUF488 family)
LIKIEKTVYDKPEALDGKRILVMRTWPRGISKDEVDVWIKDLGTDKQLIEKWKDGKIPWSKFAIEYRKSLKGKEDLLRDLAKESQAGTITLLCTDKDPNRCHRSLLKTALEDQLT